MITVEQFSPNSIIGSQIVTVTVDEPKDILELEFIVKYKGNVGFYLFKQYSVRPVKGVENIWHLLAEYEYQDEKQLVHDRTVVAVISTTDRDGLLKVIPEHNSEAYTHG